MKKTFALNGLDCPNCAAKIEAEAKKLPGVKQAACSALSSSLVLETGTPYISGLTLEIERIVHKYEPEVEVIDGDQSISAKDKDTHSHIGGGSEVIYTFASGVLLFIVALVLEGSAWQPYLYLASYAVLGWKVVYKAIRNLFKGRLLDENFLMSAASIGALVIGEYPEAVAVMLFYLIGEYFQDSAVRKSRKSITELMDIRPDFANIMVNGELTHVAPESVATGDIIIVRPGERIPLDGIVLDGKSTLDTKALTGESMPKSVKPSDDVLSGCINQSGVLTIKVTKVFGQSTVAKIIDLVENAGINKAPTENFITTFSRNYTPAVVGLAAMLAVLPPLLLAGEWAVWVNRALVFLVISCPCALVLSVPLGFFAGIGRASRNGILVKGGNFLEALSNIDIVVFDKTGTLTKGVFNVTSVYPAPNVTESDLLKHAATAEVFSNHPISLSIQHAYGKKIYKDGLQDYTELPGLGVSVVSNGMKVLAGNDKLMLAEGIQFTEQTANGTRVYVAVNHKYSGCIVISDEMKADSHSAISGLKGLGVRKAVMLTGDNKQTAEAVARELTLDEVHAQLLPDEKVKLVEALENQKRAGGKLAFIGDGVNDAPVLARADIGIAMGGLGSDAAIEAADVVLMTDEPSKLVEAVRIARATKLIVWQNIVFALGIKCAFLLLGAFGISGMWEAVFADVGVSVLAIINSMRVLRMKI